MAYTLTSTAFPDGERIPARYTADGDNVSPPLQWSDPPAGTQSFALICEDPDAPSGDFAHWVAYNIPGEARGLAEGTPPAAALPNGIVQATNDFGGVAYGGPAPPPGKPHRYIFTLYALDQRLALPAGATKEQVVGALKGHVLQEAKLTGTYGR